MTTLNISLPKAMKGFVESQLKHGGYATASEYVRDLIREAQKSAARKKLEQGLLEGLDGSPAIEVDEQYWAKKKATLKARVRKAKQRR